MAVDVKELFSAARLVARTKAKYMKALLLLFSVRETPGLGTIGVTEDSILLVDWDWITDIAKLAANDEKAALQVGGLLVHEAFHVLLEHGKRGRMARYDKAIKNIADDMSFNNAVLDMGLLLPDGPYKGVFPSDYGWDRGLTSDDYYAKLLKLMPPQKGRGGAGEPQDGSEDGDDAQGQDGDENGATGQQGGGKGPARPKRPRTGGGWCGSCAGHEFPNEPKEAKQARGKTERERAVRAVAQAVREEAQQGRGTVPEFLQRWADDLLAAPEVPWEQELAAQTRHAMAWRPNAVDHKYDAPSRRQGGIGFGPGKPMLPRFRMPVPNVAVIIDTSGSMGSGELAVAVRETAGILKAVGANVDFITCDAQVHGITKVKSAKEAIAALKGGGGTDMRPAIEEVAKLRPRPDVVVCITDLQIGDPGPEPKGTKMVWLGVGPYQGPDPSWGKTIRVKRDEKEKGR